MLPPLELDPTLVGYLALGALAVGLLAVLLAAVALHRLRRLHAGVALLRAEAGGEDFVTLLTRTIGEVGRLREDVAGARREYAGTRRAVGAALRRVAVLRYDGLGDTGGRLSFSTALLDDEGNGMVLTCINGRTESRSYAKSVSAGTSTSPLSPEEEQVIEQALRDEAAVPPRAAPTPTPSSGDQARLALIKQVLR